MRVGLNATCFNDRPSGARQRFVGIYGELVRQSPETEFVVYEPSDCRVASWFDGAPNVTARPTPIPSEGRLGKTANGLRFRAAGFGGDRLDLLEGFNLPFLQSRGGPNVLTIHDTRRLRPDWPWAERTAYRLILSRTLARADRVITVSNSMRDEILAFSPGSAVTVVYNGLDARGFEGIGNAERAAIRQTFDLPATFILAVGHLERRKNYLRLVEAVARLRDRGRHVFLVIVGNDSGYGSIIRKSIEAAGLTGSVRILSALSDAEVRSVYALSSLFVFPSSYEGFGIPLLEAMAAEKPIVLSDIPVFREITEDRGIYFPPSDVEAMAAAITTGLESSSERQRLVDYGRNRVGAFGFPQLARQIAAVHQSLLA